MKARCLLLFLSIYGFFLEANSQQITITAGSQWTDALVRKSNLSSESTFANTNYNSWQRVGATVWTHSGQPIYYRNFLKFDLSAIPVNSTIQSAVLYLYSDPAYSTGELGNQSLSGSNSLFLQKVTQTWNPTTITWNTQPATTTTGRLWIPQSTSSNENITVNISAFVQEWVNSPSTNNGFMMILENENFYRSRNYASSNHPTASIRPKLVINYTDPDPVKQRSDHVFGLLSQTEISSGVLTDYGLDLADHAKFNGTLSNDNKLDLLTWRSLYASILSSVTNPSSNLIHLKTINERLNNLRATYSETNPTIDLPTFFSAYQALRDDAISQNLLSVSNDRLIDVPGRSQSPYATNYTFASSPAIGFDVDGQVRFAFRSDLFVNNSNKSFSNFQVDFDNGAGYQLMSLNTEKLINYSSSGQKTLKFRIQFTDGSVYYSHATFDILNIISTSGRYTGVSAQDYIFPRDSDPNCPELFPDPEMWQGSFYGATVTVEYGDLGSRPDPNCNLQLIRPLIVLEGYDAHKFRSFDIPDNDFESFITLGAFNQINDDLDDAGYDLVFVNWREGTGDIIRNAYLVENIIRWVNAHKINNPVTGLREGNVILGQSMGGLVGRYAICDMEKRWLSNPTTNPFHEVRLLVTQDSPHRGANVPLGFQALVNELAPYKLTKLGLASYGVVGGIVGSTLEMRDIVPALDEADKLLDEPASRQMLLIQDGRANTFLDGAYRSMVTFNSGYTPTFQMRAVSNGSECGLPQNLLQPGGELFYGNANFYANRFLFSVGTLITGGIASKLNAGAGAFVTAALGALIPITGKKWKTSMRVLAAPSSGTNQAFRGTIAVEKRVLFLIPINVTLFDKTRNSINGSLPWDSSPGGYYNISDFQAAIPNNPNINAFPILEANLTIRIGSLFTFVPTVSALDVATTPITLAALQSPYTNGNNPTHQSRFANFVSQEFLPGGDRIGSLNNTSHISFTARTGNWVFQQIQNPTNQAAGCSYLCGNLSIAGSSSICNTGNTTYSITGLNSPNTTITWSSSNTSLLTINPTTGVASVVGGASNASVTVRAVVNGACGPSGIISKEVAIGGPQIIGNISGNDILYPGIQGYYYIDQPIGATSTDWIIPQGCWNNTFYCWESLNETSISLVVTAGAPGVYVIEYRASNSCGFSSRFINVTVLDNECPMMLQASPNPSSEEISLDVVPIVPCIDPASTQSTSKANTDISTLTIISIDGEKELEETFTGLSTKLKNHKLKKGVHIVSINNRNKVYQTRIIIE